MKILERRIPSDVNLEAESEKVAVVVCKRCGGQIGRLQTVPAEKDADEEEIYAEIELIADEHRPLCTGK